MKKLIAILLLGTLMANAAMAQKTYTTKSGVEFPANEISISYSGLNIVEFAYAIGGAIAVGITGGKADIDKIITSGALGIEYTRYISPILAVGVVGSAEQYALHFRDDDKKSSQSYLFTVMPEAKLSWFRKPHFSMYSRVALGLGISYSEEFDSLFAIQISPVGLEAGGTHFKGFAEIGNGMQGFGCGLRYCF